VGFEFLVKFGHQMTEILSAVFVLIVKLSIKLCSKVQKTVKILNNELFQPDPESYLDTFTRVLRNIDKLDTILYYFGFLNVNLGFKS